MSGNIKRYRPDEVGILSVDTDGNKVTTHSTSILRVSLTDLLGDYVYDTLVRPCDDVLLRDVRQMSLMGELESWASDRKKVLDSYGYGAPELAEAPLLEEVREEIAASMAGFRLLVTVNTHMTSEYLSANHIDMPEGITLTDPLLVLGEKRGARRAVRSKKGGKSLYGVRRFSQLATRYGTEVAASGPARCKGIARVFRRMLADECYRGYAGGSTYMIGDDATSTDTSLIPPGGYPSRFLASWLDEEWLASGEGGLWVIDAPTGSGKSYAFGEAVCDRILSEDFDRHGTTIVYTVPQNKQLKEEYGKFKEHYGERLSGKYEFGTDIVQVLAKDMVLTQDFFDTAPMTVRSIDGFDLFAQESRRYEEASKVGGRQTRADRVERRKKRDDAERKFHAAAMGLVTDEAWEEFKNEGGMLLEGCPEDDASGEERRAYMREKGFGHLLSEAVMTDDEAHEWLREVFPGERVGGACVVFCTVNKFVLPLGSVCGPSYRIPTLAEGKDLYWFADEANETAIALLRTMCEESANARVDPIYFFKTVYRRIFESDEKVAACTRALKEELRGIAAINGIPLGRWGRLSEEIDSGFRTMSAVVRSAWERADGDSGWYEREYVYADGVPRKNAYLFYYEAEVESAGSKMSKGYDLGYATLGGKWVRVGVAKEKRDEIVWEGPDCATTAADGRRYLKLGRAVEVIRSTMRYIAVVLESVVIQGYMAYCAKEMSGKEAQRTNQTPLAATTLPQSEKIRMQVIDEFLDVCGMQRTIAWPDPVANPVHYYMKSECERSHRNTVAARREGKIGRNYEHSVYERGVSEIINTIDLVKEPNHLSISLEELRDTPMRFLMDMAAVMHVCLSSATALYDTAFGNFDIEYLRAAIPGGIRTFDGGARRRFIDCLESMRATVGTVRAIPISVGTISGETELDVEVANTVPSGASGEAQRRYCHDVSSILRTTFVVDWRTNKKQWYPAERYLRVLRAYEHFATSDPHVLRTMLCATMPGPKNGDEYSRQVLDGLFSAVDAAIGRSRAKDEVVYISNTAEYDTKMPLVLADLESDRTGLVRKFVVTAYGTMGVGVNPVFTDTAGGSRVLADFDAAYADRPTHLYPQTRRNDDPAREDDVDLSATFLENIYCGEALYQKSEIFHAQLVTYKNVFMADRYARPDEQVPMPKSLKAALATSQSTRMKAAMILRQYFGRIMRVGYNGRPKQVFYDAGISGMIPEGLPGDDMPDPVWEAFTRSLAAPAVEDGYMTYLRLCAHNQLVTRRHKEAHERILKSWYSESIREHALEFKYLLHNPTAPADGAGSFVAENYVRADEPICGYAYLAIGDCDRVLIDTADVRPQAGLRDKQWHDMTGAPSVRRGEVSERACGTQEVMAIPGMREHALAEGVPTTFVPDAYIMTPYQAKIYKGALGEWAFAHILHDVVGVDAVDIADAFARQGACTWATPAPELFGAYEKADRILVHGGEDVSTWGTIRGATWADVKLWSDSRDVDGDWERGRTADKVVALDAATYLVVNVVKPEGAGKIVPDPHVERGTASDGSEVEYWTVPYLYDVQSGLCNEKALAFIASVVEENKRARDGAGDGEN